MYFTSSERSRKGTIFDALGQNAVCSSFFDFLVNALQDGIGVVALLQQDDAFDGVGIVDDCAVGAMSGSADLAEANLRALGDGGDVLDLDGRAVGVFDDGVLDVLHAGVEAQRLHIDLLRALLDKAAAAVGVVVGDLLLDLADGQAVGDELLGIEPDLVFLGRPAEAGNIDHASYALEGLLKSPVFERLSSPSRRRRGWCSRACTSRSGRRGSSRCPSAERDWRAG